MDDLEAQASKGNFDANVSNKCKELYKLVRQVEARLKTPHGEAVAKHDEITEKLDYAIKNLYDASAEWPKQ